MKKTSVQLIRNLAVLLFIFASTITVQAQTPNGFVGVGTTNPKAKLHIDNDSSGILIPKYATLALANSNSLPKLNATDHKGLMIYVDEVANQGFWYYNGTAFIKVGASGSPFFTVSPTNSTHIVYSNAANYGKNFIVNGDSVNYKGSGIESKMMFIPSKSAFRAGAVNNNDWNIDSIGANSFATGLGAKATLSSAISMGNSSKATGFNAVSIGILSTASGTNSTALGSNANASGGNSMALGTSTGASAIYSTAIGYAAIASSNFAIAIGSSDTASGAYSTALGNETKASNNYSTAMGYRSKATGTFSIAMGNSDSASGNSAIAMGVNTKAFGSASTAMGNSTNATGTNSTAMGFSDTASGVSSTAMGWLTRASGASSTAMGQQTTASGEISTAIGQNTIASGTVSTAMGINSIASGFYSTAIGSRSKAKSFGEVAVGLNNTDYTHASTSAFIANDRAFVVGIGSSSINLSDGLIVYKNGTTFLGKNTNNGMLPVTTSTLTVDGAIADSIITTTGTAFTFAYETSTVLDNNATTTSITYTLPDPSTCKGRKIAIKKINAANHAINITCTNMSNGGTIDGIVYPRISVENVVAGNYVASTATTSRKSFILQSDGSNWWVIAAF